VYFCCVKQSDTANDEKVEVNGITGKDVEIVVLTIRIWTMLKDRDHFREKSSNFRLSRQTKREKIPY